MVLPWFIVSVPSLVYVHSLTSVLFVPQFLAVAATFSEKSICPEKGRRDDSYLSQAQESVSITSTIAT